MLGGSALFENPLLSERHVQRGRTMRGVEFSELRAFASIAEHGSFAKAATQLGVSRSMLSQSLRALEERLKVRLMNRTTRSVSLTDAGNRLLARVRPALGELTSAVDEARSQQSHPAGLLKLVVQPPVASFLIEPILAPFMAAFPGVRLDVKVVKMPADIVREGFDAGIRLGEQIERDMIAVRVMEAPKFLVVGSPEYLKHHPAPKTPYDLRQHDCIRNRLPNGTIFGWQFEKKRKALQLNVDGRLIVNDIELSIRAVLDGAGLAYLLYDYISQPVEEGRLVPLLEDWSPPLSGFYLYYSSRRQIGAPLQAFIKFLADDSRRRGVAKSNLPGMRIYPNYRLVGSKPRGSVGRSAAK
jgi:DNA-binding transcriptional LysR family regulator